MLGESTHLANRKEWVSCLILIHLISHLIQKSALPARPLPGDSGKPHGATIYIPIPRVHRFLRVVIFSLRPVPMVRMRLHLRNCVYSDHVQIVMVRIYASAISPLPLFVDLIAAKTPYMVLRPHLQNEDEVAKPYTVWLWLQNHITTPYMVLQLLILQNSKCQSSI